MPIRPLPMMSAFTGFRMSVANAPLQSMPVGVPHAGHLPHLGRDQREMPFRQPSDVDPDIQHPGRPELRDYASRYDVEGLEAAQDARQRARIGISTDPQAERLRNGLF